MNFRILSETFKSACSLSSRISPGKNLMLTEACIEKFCFDRIGDWSLEEKYGYSMIGDFNNGAAGLTDWNILLDETGGPNHVGNFCFAPIIGDTKNGKLLYTNCNEYNYFTFLESIREK